MCRGTGGHAPIIVGMGASVCGYWPGITEDQRDSMPGFWNDDRAFGNWMANRHDQPEVLAMVKSLGCAAVLTYTTEGLADDDVDWVTPTDLKAAALALRELVERQDPRTRVIVDSYAKDANRIDPVHGELARDLADVATIAEYAAGEGATRMTLEVNW